MSDFLRGLPFLAVVLGSGYEWLAVTFPALRLPSISYITYGTLGAIHPLGGIAFGVFTGAMVTLLILHLTGLLSWWAP